jgi:hypothetical protein
LIPIQASFLRWCVVINVAAKQLKAMNGGPGGGSDMKDRREKEKIQYYVGVYLYFPMLNST